MTHKSILILALRIAAIVLMVDFIKAIPNLYFNYSSNLFPGYPVFLFTSLLPNLIILLTALLFWIFPTRIITSIVPDSAKLECDLEHYRNLNFAFMAAIGMFLFLEGMIDTLYFFTLIHFINEQAVFSESIIPSNKASFIASVFETLIGFLLLLGSKGVLNLIYKIRYGQQQHIQ